MKISLSSSLHLNHGAISPDLGPGDPLPMLDFVPVGLLSLKAYADQADAGADIRVIELNGLINQGKIPNDDDFYEHVVDTILEDDDDFVGLMTDADSLHHTLAIAERVKRRRTGAKICLGGPASSPMSDLLMQTFPQVDYIVRGEGEETFVELIHCLKEGKEPSEVQGLTWRKGGLRAVVNPERHLEDDLDQIPIPDFEHYDMAYGAPLYLDVGRGCPFVCSFCATAPFWKRKYRMKSADRIIAEAVLARDKYGRTVIHFSHDIFTCDKKWTLEFCQQLIDNPLGVQWTCSTRTDIIDPEVLEKLSEAGCVEIYYGIESGSARLQKEIDKNLDLDWARDIVAKTREVGIRPVTGFILGYPMEDRETLGDTLKRYFQYLEVGGFRAHLFTLSPFFESPMYRKYAAENPTAIVDKIDRPAEYYDLNLTETASQPGENLKTDFRHIFASNYRYKTPELPSRLVDASEELSASASMLKSLWPYFLKNYDAPIDFYERWVDWIEEYNDEVRPDTRFRHQADAGDLLSFVEEEIDRLEIRNDKRLADLVTYEKIKLAARKLDGPPGNGHRGGEVTEATTLQRCSHFLYSEVDHDIHALLAMKEGEEAEAGANRWVLVFKVAADQLNTIQVGQRTLDMLKGCEQPITAGELIRKALGTADPGPELDTCLRSLSQLVRVGILMEAEAVN